MLHDLQADSLVRSRYAFSFAESLDAATGRGTVRVLVNKQAKSYWCVLSHRFVLVQNHEKSYRPVLRWFDIQSFLPNGSCRFEIDNLFFAWHQQRR